MVSALLALLAAAPKLLNVEGEPAARMAYGLEVALDGTREQTARAWLQLHGGELGLMPEDELVLISDRPGVVTFDRRRAGISVMGAEVKATFDDAQRLIMVYAGPPLPRAEGGFWADVVKAELSATHGLDVTRVDASRKYWKSDGAALRPVWLVRFEARSEPFRALVDGATGRLLERLSEKLSINQGTVYDISPAKGGVVTRTLGGLTATSTTLNGSRATMRNCNGSSVGGGCIPRATANASFDFVETPSFGTSNTDRFGEVNAYYAIDRFSRWLSSLDAGVNLPLITAYTNIGGTNQGFFRGGDPQTGYSIELGQGPQADWAYEGDVTWHELGHGVVQSTANFGFYTRDSQGIYGEGGALNEGTADCLALALSGDAVLAEFLGPYLQDAGTQLNPYLRRMDSVFTCHGYDGNLDGGNPGRFGTIHDDGRILGSFFWALHQRTQAVGQYAASVALVRALDSVNGNAGFHELTIAMQQHMASRYGAQAGELVACLQCEREIPACSSRTRRMYAGETHEARLLGDDIPGAPGGNKPATFQYELAVPANTVVNFDRFAITLGMLPVVYARFNQKVAWSGATPTFDESFTSLPASLPAQPTAGTWYLQGMLRDPGMGTRRYGMRAQFSGGPARPAIPAVTCSLGGGVGPCTCMPSCSPGACGPDGCGGSCGTCDAGTMCTNGRCACVPQCTGKGCGPDGCGGTCGTCASGTCNATTGMCLGCTPMCSGKQCGPNGCGQACGQCMGANIVCDLPTGQCVDAGELPVEDAGTGGGAGGGGEAGGGEDVMGGCGCGAAPSFVVLGLAALLMLRRRRVMKG